jgi:hypothetical protein
LDSWNFIQSNNVKILKWLSSLHISAPKDSKEI